MNSSEDSARRFAASDTLYPERLLRLRQVEFFLQVGKQIQNLSLDRHVEGRAGQLRRGQGSRNSPPGPCWFRQRTGKGRARFAVQEAEALGQLAGDPGSGAEPALPVVVAFYIAPSAGKPMERAQSVKAVAGRGLVGDRYFLANGHWTGTDDCEVTIIAQEDIDEIERRSVVRIQNGEHRRNMVIRNLPIENLTGKRFHIGSACFGYERPRPPCAYIQMISEPGMTKALGRRAGICVRCIKSGVIQEGDQIVILSVTLLQALRYRAKVIFQHYRPKNRGHR